MLWEQHAAEGPGLSDFEGPTMEGAIQTASDILDSVHTYGKTQGWTSECFGGFSEAYAVALSADVRSIK